MINLIILAILFVSTILLAFFHFREINVEKLNFIHRRLARFVLVKWEKYLNQIQKDKQVIVNYNDLMDQLNFLERDFVERLYRLDPQNVGFKGPKYSIAQAEELVQIDSVKFYKDGKVERESGIQYVPKHVNDDFVRMNNEISKEIGKMIYIDSGYRSAGRQAYLFLKYLITEQNFSIRNTARWSAMPGYSEHGDPFNTAVDISNAEGINGFSDDQKPEDFEILAEFNWLQNNAQKFNFHLSYPKNNDFGVAYEPWHWHWEKIERNLNEQI